MITYQDIKEALEHTPFDITDVTPEKSLANDYNLSEDEISEVLYFVEMELGISFPDDDAFYRFAAVMPIGELADSANVDWDELY